MPDGTVSFQCLISKRHSRGRTDLERSEFDLFYFQGLHCFEQWQIVLPDSVNVKTTNKTSRKKKKKKSIRLFVLFVYGLAMQHVGS